MSTHHLISIEADQLRNWRGSPDDLLINVGAAVVLTCLDPTTSGVSIEPDPHQLNGAEGGSPIVVKHVGQHEGDEFTVWAWVANDELYLADLSCEDLDLLEQFVQQLKADQSISGQAGRQSQL